MPQQPPRHWPKDCIYLGSSKIHSSLSKETRAYIGTTPGGQPVHSRSWVIIKIIETPSSHPACGQRGLFAAKKIPPRTYIVDYIGELHSDERPKSNYDLSLIRLSNGIDVGIDATCMGNEARFVNDFRGIASKPNSEFKDMRNTSGELRMSIWSGTEAIKKGEEILISYGKAWWRARSENEEDDTSTVGVECLFALTLSMGHEALTPGQWIHGPHLRLCFTTLSHPSPLSSYGFRSGYTRQPQTHRQATKFRVLVRHLTATNPTTPPANAQLIHGTTHSVHLPDEQLIPLTPHAVTREHKVTASSLGDHSARVDL